MSVVKSMDDFGTGLRLCELRFLAVFEDWPACEGDCQGHHMVNKSKAKGNALKFINKNWGVFGSDVCPVHNRDRYADTKVAQAYLLDKRIRDLGFEYVSGVWEEWKTHWKTFPPELEIEAILHFLPQFDDYS